MNDIYKRAHKLVDLYIEKYRDQAASDDEALVDLRSHSWLADVRVYINSNDITDDFALAEDAYFSIEFRGLSASFAQGAIYELKINNATQYLIDVPSWLADIERRLLGEEVERSEYFLSDDRPERVVVHREVIEDKAAETKAAILDQLLGSGTVSFSKEVR